MFSIIKYWTCSDNTVLGGWLNILFSVTSGHCSWFKLTSSPAAVELNFASMGTYSLASWEFSFLVPLTDFWISVQSLITRFPSTTRKFDVQTLQPKCCFSYCLGRLDGNLQWRNKTSRPQPEFSNSKSCRRLKTFCFPKYLPITSIWKPTFTTAENKYPRLWPGHVQICADKSTVTYFFSADSAAVKDPCEESMGSWDQSGCPYQQGSTVCPSLAVRIPRFFLDGSHTVSSYRQYFSHGESS